MLNAMSQEVSFRNSGVNLVSIGSHIEELYTRSVSEHPESNKIVCAFPETYEYWYFPSDSLLVAGTNRINHLIIASDDNTKVVAIFIFFENASNEVSELITNVYGAPTLSSNSTISGIATNSKLFWISKDDIEIFCTTQSNKNSVTVTIKKQMIAGVAPSVYIMK